MSTRMFALLAFVGMATAARRAEMGSGVWAPNDVDIVSNALDAILAQPHLTKEQLTSAQHVAATVKQNLAAVEQNKLKGEARRQKVGEALAALTGLQQEWEEKANKAKTAEQATDKHMEDLQHELETKKALLAKEQDQMKVIVLEKELMEKKLKLNTLMEAKQVAAEKKAKEQEEKERDAVYQTLAAAAEKMPSGQAKVDAISHLNVRVTSVRDAITQMDVGQKKKEDKIAKMGTDNKDPKMAKMLTSIKKKEHREFAKAKAMKNNELSALVNAVANLQKGDVSAVKDSLNKMKRDAKAVDARSGDFLH